MTDFLLELRSEEIPARMQDKAREDLARLFAAELAKAGIAAAETITYATPRRLALIAHGLPEATEAVREETKGPPADAPDAAVEGFLRKAGVTRDALETRDVKGRATLFAVIEKPGRATADVLAAAIPAIVRAFPWPKSMRWGDASLSTESLRWVRPLQGIVALFGEEIVPVSIAGVGSGAATLGHRFHHPGAITIGAAADYVEKLRACHVIVDQAERRTLIRDRAAALAVEAGLVLVEDEGLVAENAGLTEWPVPLLGRFDEAFLDVPPEVIQLTARVNQKYFVCREPSPLPAREGPGVGDGSQDSSPQNSAASRDQQGKLANAFICTANIAAADDGARIVEGNRKVLAARLADARFFYETDLKTPLESQAEKLKKIVFHEKLGTVADKVDRVAKLARWLVEEGIIPAPLPSRKGPAVGGESHDGSSKPTPTPDPSLPGRGALADLAERAARLAKADLVTGMVGEFPELQGLMGGYYAAAQGEHPAVAAAIRDHYKPVGQGDDVPADPVTVAVSLADKLDTLVGFFYILQPPTGTRDPYALRRATISILRQVTVCHLRLSLDRAVTKSVVLIGNQIMDVAVAALKTLRGDTETARKLLDSATGEEESSHAQRVLFEALSSTLNRPTDDKTFELIRYYADRDNTYELIAGIIDFFADRLKVQQREAGVRHDLIDAVFALGGEDDLVRLLARVHALQAFVGTADGANLLAGYKRAANILKKEGYTAAAPQPAPLPSREGPGVSDESHDGSAKSAPTPDPSLQGRGEEGLSYTPEKAESDLIVALDAAEPAAATAVSREDFEGAMAALATLRAPIDAFFDAVTVNDPDPTKRTARLALLDRVRAAVHQVADFSRIEG